MSALMNAHRPTREHEIDPEPTDSLSDAAKVLVWAIVLGCSVLAFHLIALASGGAW